MCPAKLNPLLVLCVSTSQRPHTLGTFLSPHLCYPQECSTPPRWVQGAMFPSPASEPFLAALGPPRASPSPTQPCGSFDSYTPYSAGLIRPWLWMRKPRLREMKELVGWWGRRLAPASAHLLPNPQLCALSKLPLWTWKLISPACSRRFKTQRQPAPTLG